MNDQLVFWANPWMMFIKMMVAINRSARSMPVIVIVVQEDDEP